MEASANINNVDMENRFNKMNEQFSLAYDLIVSYHLNEDKQIMLSDGDNPKKCRFCGRSYPEVSFNKVAHALSHMVENRHLKSDYECDECNELFSKVETDFSAYMNLYHTMFQVYGKGGIPKYKLNSKQKSKIEVSEDNLIKINLQEGEEPIIIWEEKDKANNSIEIKGKRTYTPQNVLRALVKMAMTIIPPSELSNLQGTMNWLMFRPCEGMLLPVYLRIYRQPLPFTSAMIFKRKDFVDNINPHYVFVLAYKNIVFQVPLPMVEADKKFRGKKIKFPMMPTPLDLTLKPIVDTMLDLRSNNRIRGEEVSIGLKYASAQQTFQNPE